MDLDRYVFIMYVTYFVTKYLWNTLLKFVDFFVENSVISVISK